MRSDTRYFVKCVYSPKQVAGFFASARRDIEIAQQVDILEVKFNYSYNAFIKAGIALLGFHSIKVRGVAGHHMKIIEKLSALLEDENIEEVGNRMRTKRNMDFYSGGAELTEKETREHLEFVAAVLEKVECKISGVMRR